MARQVMRRRVAALGELAGGQSAKMEVADGIMAEDRMILRALADRDKAR